MTGKDFSCLWGVNMKAKKASIGKAVILGEVSDSSLNVFIIE